MSNITIDSLFIYPIKSCGGIRIAQAHIGSRGLSWNGIDDRRFMLARTDGTFITQREVEKLALVRTDINWDDPTHQSVIVSAEGSGSFVLTSKDRSMEQISIKMHNKRKFIDGKPANLGREETTAHIVRGDGGEWFRKFLGDDDIRLVYQNDNDIRPVDKAFAKWPGKDVVSLADGYQALVTSLESLRAINTGMRADNPDMGEDKPMNRFRPNIVVKGGAAYDENLWEQIRMGAVHMFGVKPCTRCKITGLDQSTGVYEGPEIVTYLTKHRRVNYIQNDTPVIGPIFGENLLPFGEGVIRWREEVKVVHRKLQVPGLVAA